MIERRSCRALLLSLTFAVLPQVALAVDDCTRLTATGNPEYPPYLWRDPQDPQHLVGANADLLKYMADELGLDVDVKYSGPWGRAQEEVRTGRVDLLAGYFLTRARQNEVNFIEPPFLHTPSVVWVRSDSAFAYKGWDDLRGLKGGVLVNNSHGEQFDEFARTNLNLEAVPGARQAFEKLLHKRSDYVIFEQFPGMALARVLKVDEQVQVLEPPVSSEGLYLAMSHDSPCNRPQLREQLAAKMREIVSSDLPQRLVARNLALWRQQQENVAAP
ncbi:amino acid ABC transporter substrate-binding protein [Pseudomonas putida]|uniref:substrate-binding periplasmic protein n=1 Tax=Pseudomonas putida TaxID=303 RepID=UPI0007B6DE2A|nr:transporter substrate-binding domain-containing protein [Pseudomonas putida]ANC03660.1 amino acid ABC transporter substrate-binding protein [Pseudomonas putida]